MTDRRATQVLVEAAAEDPAPNRRATQVLVEAAAEDPAPNRRFSQIVIEVAAEEWWHGWGAILNTGDE